MFRENSHFGLIKSEYLNDNGLDNSGNRILDENARVVFTKQPETVAIQDATEETRNGTDTVKLPACVVDNLGKYSCSLYNM